MNRRARIITAVVVVLALGAATMVLAASRPGDKSTPNQTQQQPKNAEATPAQPAANPEVTIYFNDYGFSPNLISMPVGTKVIIKNVSKGNLNMHDAWGQNRVENTDFNLGDIPAGSSKSFVMSREGVWQYEGNGNPEVRGQIGTGPLQPNLDQLTPAVSSTTPSTVTNGGVLLDFVNYGFMPNQITVPVGTKITVRNSSDKSQPGPMVFGQNPNQAEKNPELNIGTIQKKQEKTFTITKKGTWLFENVYQAPFGKGLGQITAF